MALPPRKRATPSAPERSLLTATRDELTKAGRADTALGQACLTLAARIDAGQDTGSAIASLTREWRASMEVATRDSSRKADGLDELGARRERKAAGA